MLKYILIFFGALNAMSILGQNPCLPKTNSTLEKEFFAGKTLSSSEKIEIYLGIGGDFNEKEKFLNKYDSHILNLKEIKNSKQHLTEVFRMTHQRFFQTYTYNINFKNIHSMETTIVSQHLY